MKLIESSFTILEEQDPFKAIELAGRTCYKSEDKITEDSAKAFVDMLIKRGHGAMLEHGTVYLKMPWGQDYKTTELVSKFRYNPYTKTVFVSVNGDPNWYITTNYRVLVENNLLEAIEPFICIKPEQHHERRISVRFVCDRGVSHELVRHRVFSFAQESTRFCNYSKEKFSNELTFIIPSWLEETLKPKLDEDGHLIEHPGAVTGIFKQAENVYLGMIDAGYKPQQARQVLPNALKTELVMTGFVSQWEAAFKLRCAENAHPDCRKLMVPLKEEFIKRGYINEQ